jgi:hypothetical protein
VKEKNMENVFKIIAQEEKPFGDITNEVGEMLEYMRKSTTVRNAVWGFWAEYSSRNVDIEKDIRRHALKKEEDKESHESQEKTR